MAKILLKQKNSLPFEAQNHCKLSLKDIEDIQQRYENGEKMTHIHLDYPQVSYIAIRYWANSEFREQDLARRKQEDSYIFADREKHDKKYLNDLKERRKENNLPVSSYIRGQYATSDTTPLTKEQRKTIEKLYENGYSTHDIEKETGIKYTKCQSYFDNINNEWYIKARQNRKDKRQKLLNSLLSDKLNGMSRNELSNKYNLDKKYISDLLWKAGYRKHD